MAEILALLAEGGVAVEAGAGVEGEVLLRKGETGAGWRSRTAGAPRINRRMYLSRSAPPRPVLAAHYPGMDETRHLPRTLGLALRWIAVAGRDRHDLDDPGAKRLGCEISGSCAEERSVSAALEKVANEVGNGVSLGAVAIAWALQKSTYAFPIVGGRNAQQLEEVLKALNIVLTPEQIKSLEGAAPFVFGFPYLPLFGTDPALGDGRGNFFVSSVGTVKFVKAPARSSLVLERTSRLLAYAMYQCGFAGIGGLAVAYALSKAGQRVRVLEKNNLNVPSGGHRMTPNSSKILRQWIGEEELMKSAVRCVRCKTFDLRTGEAVGYIEWKPAVIAETGGDFLLMHRNDLVRILHRLATDAGAIVDFHAEVTSVQQGTEEDPKPAVTLATGEIIKADVLVGADGCKSLVRKVVLEEEDCAEPVRMTLYTGVIDAKDMVTDPDLAPYISSDEWAIGMSPGRCMMGHPVAARTQYAIHLFYWDKLDRLPQGGEESWEDLCSIDGISTSDAYGPAFQTMLKLTTNLIRTQWKNHENTVEWVDSTGRMVLLGDAAHPSFPGGTHSISLAIEDAVVLGSLFSHLSTIDQVPSFLGAYQELRQRRCELVMAADVSNARMMTFPDGPLADKRNADMRAKNDDWDEGTLKAQFEEIAEIFAYDAGDAAEEWWVNWGRFSAAARERPSMMNIFSGITKCQA
ncbi:hypothetical protein BD311DRAFT_671189 [Dichomitus squalens]|uniref:FAD/NAD(P)-binding domain-containing protein n=1 Tax=Dichomitus squalens TaxID=114155 RepID=A0A4Q9MC14_9APHY|nr:hypothetical protein BD311DRAFT_671189 [Dichomitus squalens]